MRRALAAVLVRINVLLLLAVLGSALHLVHTEYAARTLYTALDKARAQQRALAEQQRTLLQQRAQAMPAQFDALAQEQLRMHFPTAATTQYLIDSP